MLRNLIFTILMLIVIVLAQQGPTQDETVNTTIDQLFSKPIGVPDVNDCPGGECVPYYQCNNNTFVVDGEGIFNVRFDKQPCVDYLETCCGTGDVIITPVTPKPSSRTKAIGCGYRNPNSIAFRIDPVAGQSEFAEFPWMVAILTKETMDSSHTYKCGGSLIHPKVVLTGAHCTHGKHNQYQANMIKIRAGEWDTQTTNEIYPYQDRNVAEIIVHAQYVKRTLHNDIALLVLSESVDLVENVQTVCLPPVNKLFDSSTCTTTGWGKEVFGNAGIYQVILKKVDLPVVPNTSCQTALRQYTTLGRYFRLHASFICAGGEYGIDACQGDGGSPLVCPMDNTVDRYYQSGIVAWGMGCGQLHVPGVYVSVAKFRNWIDQNFLQRNLATSSYTAS